MNLNITMFFQYTNNIIRETTWNGRQQRMGDAERLDPSQGRKMPGCDETTPAIEQGCSCCGRVRKLLCWIQTAFQTGNLQSVAEFVRRGKIVLGCCLCSYRGLVYSGRSYAMHHNNRPTRHVPRSSIYMKQHVSACLLTLQTAGTPPPPTRVMFAIFSCLCTCESLCLFLVPGYVAINH